MTLGFDFITVYDYRPTSMLDLEGNAVQVRIFLAVTAASLAEVT